MEENTDTFFLYNMMSWYVYKNDVKWLFFSCSFSSLPFEKIPSVPCGQVIVGRSFASSVTHEAGNHHGRHPWIDIDTYLDPPRGAKWMGVGVPFFATPLQGACVCVFCFTAPHRIYAWYNLYFLYLHEWLILMVNSGKYTIHGSYGFKDIFWFSPRFLQRWSKLTNIFHRAWNHQLAWIYSCFFNNRYWLKPLESQWNSMKIAEYCDYTTHFLLGLADDLRFETLSLRLGSDNHVNVCYLHQQASTYNRSYWYDIYIYSIFFYFLIIMMWMI